MATSQRKVMWYVCSTTSLQWYSIQHVQRFMFNSVLPIWCFQWSYGVTMWEIFSGGKSPYPGTDPLTLMQRLEEGDRMPKPTNAACTEEM